MPAPATAAERILAAVPTVYVGDSVRPFFERAVEDLLAAQRGRIAAYAEEHGYKTLAKQIRSGEAG